jgi:hypothetical protein
LKIEKKVENIKERIALLNEMIKVGEDEIKTHKIKDRYLTEKYKELNNAYIELKKHDPDN